MKREQVLDELLELYREAQTAAINEWGGTFVRDGKLCSMTDEEAIESLSSKIAYYRNVLKDEPDTCGPRPLLFGGLEALGFRVIISDQVPDNQIWFATDEQLQEALEYSQKQIDMADHSIVI